MAAEDNAALARRLIPLLDLTSLDEDDTPEKIAALCKRAVTPFGNVAAICIYPRFVKQAKELLAGSGIHVSALINYPYAMNSPREVAAVVGVAIADGADEIELLSGWGRYWSNDRPKMAAHVVIRAARKACGEHTLKVAIETGSEHQCSALVKASQFSMHGGADFLKLPSRNAIGPGWLESADLMLRAVRAGRGPAKVLEHALPRIDPGASDREQAEMLIEVFGYSSVFRPERAVGFIAGDTSSLSKTNEILELVERSMGTAYVDAQTLRICSEEWLLDDILAVVDCKPTRQGPGNSSNTLKSSGQAFHG